MIIIEHENREMKAFNKCVYKDASLTLSLMALAEF